MRPEAGTTKKLAEPTLSTKPEKLPTAVEERLPMRNLRLAAAPQKQNQPV